MTERSRRPMTPHEIRTVQLPRTGYGRGYDPAAVQELLRRLAEETARRDRTISELTSRLGGAPLAPPTGGGLEERLAEVDLRLRAQQYADEVVALAQYAAAQIVEQGRQQAGQLLADAHRTSEQTAHAYRSGLSATVPRTKFKDGSPDRP